jgi:hypothetical protein
MLRVTPGQKSNGIKRLDVRVFTDPHVVFNVLGGFFGRVEPLSHRSPLFPSGTVLAQISVKGFTLIP